MILLKLSSHDGKHGHEGDELVLVRRGWIVCIDLQIILARFSIRIFLERYCSELTIEADVVEVGRLCAAAHSCFLDRTLEVQPVGLGSLLGIDD